MEAHDEAVRRRGWGVSGYRGNTLSCSYTDVNKNPDKRLGTVRNRKSAIGGRKEPYIVYGWERVEANSLLRAGDGDLHTPQIVVGRSGEGGTGLDIWDYLENSSEGAYNEVALLRYDETGKARRPDYLVKGMVKLVMILNIMQRCLRCRLLILNESTMTLDIINIGGSERKSNFAALDNESRFES